MKLGHVELAKKMRKRDPATAPTLGDRVAYVHLKVSAPVLAPVLSLAKEQGWPKRRTFQYGLRAQAAH